MFIDRTDHTFTITVTVKGSETQETHKAIEKRMREWLMECPVMPQGGFPDGALLNYRVELRA